MPAKLRINTPKAGKLNTQRASGKFPRGASSKPAKHLFVGTSGWVYKEWAGEFYPGDLPTSGELAYYASQLNSVEINATFYRLPTGKMVNGWYQRTPPDFLFAIKGSRFITHIKRLVVQKLAIKRFFDCAKLLKDKRGPVLWQLPPNFSFNKIKVLDTFLVKLPADYRHAVEFRHPSWYDHEETFEVLRNRNVAHVSLSSLRMPMNLTVTTDLAYLRFHGLAGGARHDYKRGELKPWAEHARRLLRRGIPVYAYFNNDLNTRAPGNAKLLWSMITDTSLRSL